MALRILPFRQYNENDVVNLYRSLAANASVTDSGDGDAGVFVKVNSADLNVGPIAYETSSYLGKTDYAFVGADQLPVVQSSFTVATSGHAVLGITLAQTAQTDENGEKLIYYPQKQLELQAVHSGQAVPVLTQGIVTISSDAYVGTLTPGHFISIGATDGKIEGHSNKHRKSIGTVLATGSRVAGLSADQFAGSAGSTGAYAMIQIGGAL
jgi:hypothetical protein|tara:strand:- start:5881 stop:6510 length:630 start_codon:yes stop_codon:yes gene_type:complete